MRKRIQHVYSLDGPGFPPEIVTSPAYRTIQPKVTKIVPSSSIVGMIFETPEPCRVVSSDSDGIMQHSAFTWLLDGDQFITEPDLSSSSQLFNEELNHWIATLTPEQRERAVDALFTVLHANGATSFSEVMSNFPASIPAMLGAYVGLTPADRRHLVEALAILFKRPRPNASRRPPRLPHQVLRPPKQQPRSQQKLQQEQIAQLRPEPILMPMPAPQLRHQRRTQLKSPISS